MGAMMRIRWGWVAEHCSEHAPALRPRSFHSKSQLAIEQARSRINIVLIQVGGNAHGTKLYLTPHGRIACVSILQPALGKDAVTQHCAVWVDTRIH